MTKTRHKRNPSVSFGAVVPGVPLATREQVIAELQEEVRTLRSLEKVALAAVHKAEDANRAVSASRGRVMGLASILETGPFGH